MLHLTKVDLSLISIGQFIANQIQFLLTRVLRTIKSGDFTLLPNYELACYSFMGVGRVHKTSGSEGCCLRMHSNRDIKNIRMFASVP